MGIQGGGKPADVVVAGYLPAVAMRCDQAAGLSRWHIQWQKHGQNACVDNGLDERYSLETAHTT